MAGRAVGVASVALLQVWVVDLSFRKALRRAQKVQWVKLHVLSARCTLAWPVLTCLACMVALNALTIHIDTNLRSALQQALLLKEEGVVAFRVA